MFMSMTNRERIGQFLGALGQAVDTAAQSCRLLFVTQTKTNQNARLVRLTSYLVPM